MFNGIKESFDTNQNQDQFTMVDNSHPINIYAGRDTSYRYTLFIYSPVKPIQLRSSALIEVYIGLRDDNHWGISLSLNDVNLLEPFCHFCNDIIQSSRHISDTKKGIHFICERYEQWQKMLKKDTLGLLKKSQIKGIIGELMFLKNILIPKYGEHIALSSWLGPEMLPQDFMCDSKWYEIKSISSNSGSVQISSLEQLDVSLSGELLVVYLDSTSTTYSNKLQINQYYNEILKSLTSDEDKVILTNKLLNLGYYPRDEYDEYAFKFSKCTKYEVTSNFPCLRKTEIPISITSAKYELSLPSISGFLLEVLETWK